MAEARNGDAKGATAGKGQYDINLDTFGKRLKALYACWSDFKQDLWGGADALAVVTPPTSEDLRYLKSSALHTWLLGYEFPETIMMFMQGRILVLCSPKKASLLEDLRRSSKKLFGVELIIHVKARNEDGASQMQRILEAVAAVSKPESGVIGWLAREAPEGPLMEKWTELLRGSGFKLMDVSGGFSELFAVKDESEIQNIRKASFLCASVLKNYVVPKVEDVIDEEETVTHAELMDDTEKAVIDPSKAKVKLKPDNVDICYPPVFQSGGVFDLRPSAISNEEPLYYDALGVIICAIGARYNSYCSNVARSYLIDAEPVQEKAYKVLSKAHEAAINSLKPGSPASAAYRAALEAEKKGGGSWVANDSRELFYSFHRDEVAAESVMHKCVVHFIPPHKQAPPRSKHPGFIVRRVYDTVEKKLWRLTDKDYEDSKQAEIDLLVQKTRNALGDLLDIEPDEVAAEQEESEKNKRQVRKRIVPPINVMKDEQLSIEVSARDGGRPDTPGSCLNSDSQGGILSEGHVALHECNALTGNKARDRWLEKIVLGVKYVCNVDKRAENAGKSNEDIVMDENSPHTVENQTHQSSEEATLTRLASSEREQTDTKKGDGDVVWPETAVTAVVALERSTYELLGSDMHKYNLKMRQLEFNLKNGVVLARRLLKKELEPTKVSNMTPAELKDCLTAEEKSAQEPEEPETMQMADVRCTICGEKKVGVKDMFHVGYCDRYQEIKQPKDKTLVSLGFSKYPARTSLGFGTSFGIPGNQQFPKLPADHKLHLRNSLAENALANMKDFSETLQRMSQLDNHPEIASPVISELHCISSDAGSHGSHHSNENLDTQSNGAFGVNSSSGLVSQLETGLRPLVDGSSHHQVGVGEIQEHNRADVNIRFANEDWILSKSNEMEIISVLVEPHLDQDRSPRRPEIAINLSPSTSDSCGLNVSAAVPINTEGKTGQSVTLNANFVDSAHTCGLEECSHGFSSASYERDLGRNANNNIPGPKDAIVNDRIHQFELQGECISNQIYSSHYVEPQSIVNFDTNHSDHQTLTLETETGLRCLELAGRNLECSSKAFHSVPITDSDYNKKSGACLPEREDIDQTSVEVSQFQHFDDAKRRDVLYDNKEAAVTWNDCSTGQGFGILTKLQDADTGSDDDDDEIIERKQDVITAAKESSIQSMELCTEGFLAKELGCIRADISGVGLQIDLPDDSQPLVNLDSLGPRGIGHCKLSPVLFPHPSYKAESNQVSISSVSEQQIIGNSSDCCSPLAAQNEISVVEICMDDQKPKRETRGLLNGALDICESQEDIIFKSMSESKSIKGLKHYRTRKGVVYSEEEMHVSVM